MRCQTARDVGCNIVKIPMPIDRTRSRWPSSVCTGVRWHYIAQDTPMQNATKIAKPAFALLTIGAFLLLGLLLLISKISAQLTHKGARIVAVGCSAVAPNSELSRFTPSSIAVSFAYPVATSNRRFVDQSGSVHLLKMMSSWAMAQRCSNAAITSALEGLKSLGFNAVTVAPFGVHLNDSFGDRYRNESGQRFFTGVPFASAFGPAWSSMDWIVEEATRLQMTSCAFAISELARHRHYTGFANRRIHE